MTIRYVTEWLYLQKEVFSGDMNIKEIIACSGMSITEFAKYLNIPYKTVQKWNAGERVPPIWATELIEYKLIKENIIKR